MSEPVEETFEQTVARLAPSLLERIPLNVMIRDRSMTIRYINQASLRTFEAWSSGSR
ncbi:MAG: hypothetical protein R2705_11315 [Ilumatobacteraceae bacterium]